MSLSSVLSVVFKGDSTAFDATAKGIQSKTEGLGKELMRAFAGFSAVAVIKQLANTADVLVDTAAQLGVGTRALQQWEYAAKMSGSSSEEVANAIRKMNERLGDIEPTEELKIALDRLKLSFNDLRAMSPEDAFRKVTAAISEIPSRMDQSSMAVEFFGKSGARLLPMINDLEELTDQAEKFGQVMGDDAVVALDRMQDHLNIATKFGQVAVAKLVGNWADLWDWLGKKSAGVSDDVIAFEDAVAERDKARKDEKAKRDQQAADLEILNREKVAKAEAKAAKESEALAKKTQAELERLYKEREKLAEDLADKQNALAEKVKDQAIEADIAILTNAAESVEKRIALMQVELDAQIKQGEDAVKAAKETQDKLAELAKKPMANRMQALRDEERETKRAEKEKWKLAEDTADAMDKAEKGRHLTKWQRALVDAENERRAANQQIADAKDAQDKIVENEQLAQKLKDKASEDEMLAKRADREQEVKDAENAIAKIKEAQAEAESRIAKLGGKPQDVQIAVNIDTDKISNALSVGLKGTDKMSLTDVVTYLRLINESIKEITARAG